MYYMDDIIKLIIILFIFIFGGTQLYCNFHQCSQNMTQLALISVFGLIYMLNIYFVIMGFQKYKGNDLWKIVGFLVIVPYIIYKRMCGDKCEEMFYPIAFIALPCIMIILNIYFLWSNAHPDTFISPFRRKKIKIDLQHSFVRRL